MNDDELTPDEKREFEDLPRQAAPSPFLWERIVHALREDGTLRSPGAVPVRHSASGAGARWLRPWVVAAASMAASVVLFGSGALMGHSLGARSTERTLLAVREQDAAHLAQRVQEAGSAYVSALAALSDLRPELSQGREVGVAAAPARAAFEIRQGREAAVASLYGAAVELSRLAPGDPGVSEVLRLLEDLRFQGNGVDAQRQQTWN